MGGKIIARMKLLFALVILAGWLAPAIVTRAGTPELIPADTTKAGDKHVRQPITLQLMDLIAADPEIGRLLEKSIAAAKKINPDPATNPIQSLSAYFDFVDRSAVLLPRAQIGDDMHYFFFLVDQPLPELTGKGLYKNSLQFHEPFASWLRDLADSWGAFLNSTNSWNKEISRQFAGDPRFGVQRGWDEAPENWRTFNQFFSRRLKSPEMRPIAAPDDPSVVAAPADSVPRGVWTIDEQSNIHVENGLKVKNRVYFSIRQLLGKDSHYQSAFAKGTLTHAYLSPIDYHRYHFAVGGTVKEKRVIQKNVVVEIKWNPEKRVYEVIDSTGWQFAQTRDYVIIDTGRYGLVALIPVGMDFVSSVNFEDNIKVGDTYKKGDMLGTFLFGGSDFIMLFQEKAGFAITAPAENAKPDAGHEGKAAVFKHILMGAQYGMLQGKPGGEK